jgi:hypothetical protein
MDNPHKMIAGGEFWGLPHETKVLLVEAIGLAVKFIEDNGFDL